MPSTAHTRTPITLTAAQVRLARVGELRRVQFPVRLPHFKPSTTPGYQWTFRGIATAKSERGHMKRPSGCWQDVRTPELLKLCPVPPPGSRLDGLERWASPSATSRLIAYEADATCGVYAEDGDGGLLWVSHGFILEAEKLPELLGRVGRRFGLARYGGRWRAAARMPPWAVRIRLTVTAVTVEPAEGAGWNWAADVEPAAP